MRVLVIPDVHLKHWMFDDADSIIKEKKPDGAVVLGDLVDDFGHDKDGRLYEETLKRAMQFHKDHPGTLWCKGNHDMAYLWNIPCSGTSRAYSVQDIAIKGLAALYDETAEHSAFVHKVDNTLFSHAGVSRMYVRDHRGAIGYDNADAMIEHINSLHADDMWYDDSPIWLRPQKVYSEWGIGMYKPKKLFQVVGHSPMKEVTQEGNLISCDTFSTYRNGLPYGNEAFCIFDTVTGAWESVSSSRKGSLVAYTKLFEEYQKD